MNSGNFRHFADGLTYTRFALIISSAVIVLCGIYNLLSFPFRLNLQDKAAVSFLDSADGLSGLSKPGAVSANFASHGLFYYPKTEVAAAGPGLDEILKPFHLIGIIQGDKPEALIKNDLNQQTYFVRAGENFEKFRVIEILTNRIQVEFENQNKEMLLEGNS